MKELRADGLFATNVTKYPVVQKMMRVMGPAGQGEGGRRGGEEAGQGQGQGYGDGGACAGLLLGRGGGGKV